MLVNKNKTSFSACGTVQKFRTLPTKHVASTAAAHEEQRRKNEQRLKEDNIHLLGIQQEDKMNQMRKDQTHLYSQVDMMMDSHSKSIDMKREKLRRLLEEERREYFAELEQQPTAATSRIDELKRKVEKIRSARKQHKEKWIAEKMQQMFLRDCGEYREYKINERRKFLGEEHELQMRENVEKRQEEKERDKIFHQLYMDDYEVKGLKEAESEKNRRTAAKETSKELKERVVQLDEERLGQVELVKEMGKEVREEMAKAELEKAKLYEEKLRKQEYWRNELQYQMDVKKQINERTRAKNNALDAHVLDNALSKFSRETEESKLRKLEMRYETQRFNAWKAYADKLKEEDEQIIDEEMLKEIEKKTEKQRKLHEKDAQKRYDLMEDVVCGRRMQMRDKNLMKEKEKEESEKFLQLEMERINLLKEQEILERNELCRKKMQTRKDLEEQMKFKIERENDLDRKRVLEFECMEEAEKAYRKRVEYEMTKAPPRHIHPIQVHHQLHPLPRTSPHSMRKEKKIIPIPVEEEPLMNKQADCPRSYIRLTSDRKDDYLDLFPPNETKKCLDELKDMTRQSILANTTLPRLVPHKATPCRRHESTPKKSVEELLRVAPCPKSALKRIRPLTSDEQYEKLFNSNEPGAIPMKTTIKARPKCFNISNYDDETCMKRNEEPVKAKPRAQSSGEKMVRKEEEFTCPRSYLRPIERKSDSLKEILLTSHKPHKTPETIWTTYKREIEED
ncbi:hypothetical protein SNEBB_011088 [Seison nebaliae]|nr:hypothetical protein SNEBB_011088 [Seison nebaliae]